jgi:hypothetical protein
LKDCGDGGRAPDVGGNEIVGRSRPRSGRGAPQRDQGRQRTGSRKEPGCGPSSAVVLARARQQISSTALATAAPA